MAELLKLGHDLIDTQHSDLYHCIKQLIALANKNYTAEEVSTSLGLLSGMLRRHFVTEESIMARLGLPSDVLDVHRQEHERILTELTEMHFAEMGGKNFSLQEICVYAKEWVEGHFSKKRTHCSNCIRAFHQAVLPAIFWLLSAPPM